MRAVSESGVLLGDSFRAWVQTVGTIGAVTLELFLQLWLPYWRRPKLQLQQFNRTSDSPDWVKDDVSGARTGVWLHLRVLNKGRRDAARDAELVLIESFTVESARARRLTKNPVELRAFRWGHVPRTRADIAAGLELRINLGQIVEPLGSDPLQFDVATFPKLGTSRRNLLGAGSHRFGVMLTASNAKSVTYGVDVECQPAVHDTDVDLLNTIAITVRPDYEPIARDASGVPGGAAAARAPLV